jgi:hypothetical protein
MSRYLALFLLFLAQYPRFETYRIARVFTGAPATPRLTTPEQRRNRSAIIDGMRNGPNFAGHYIVVDWACGPGCIHHAIVDAKSGAVFAPPAGGELEYRPGSALMIVRTNCAAGTPGECDRDYFVWSDQKFARIESTRRE